MKEFFGPDVFLDNETSKILYNEVKDLPIFDYHCHLSPKEIAEDRVFYDLGELWLEGDHYKWRLMRAAGVDEELVTGAAPYHEKFIAFAKAVEYAAGNPVYHWIHFELNRYFGISTPLSSETAEEIWIKTKEMMKDGSFSARKLIKRSNVEAVFTTDDPADTLEYHAFLKKDFDVRVSPSFRPDAAVCGITKPGFTAYIEKLGKSAGMKITTLDSLKNALERRLDFFCLNTCKVADISLTTMPYQSGASAKKAFEKALAGEKVTPDEAAAFTFELLVFLSNEYARRGVTSQLHLSAKRNNNSRLFAKVGPDCGNDSVGKVAELDAFASLLDAISQNGGMPKTIVYTLNPANYYELATMIGNFWGANGGKLFLGAAWWFCDHRDGIKEQLKVYADTSSLGSFNGMLTDSRSFTSYARHDYFRRILCSYVGERVEEGEYPLDAAKRLVKKVSIENARKQFN